MRSILLQVPESLKAKLDRLREQGLTINGFLRFAAERELDRRKPKRSRGKERRA